MSHFTQPLENILRVLLPNQTEKLVTQLRYLERSFLPQTLSGLKKHGVSAETIEELRRVRVASQVSECVFTTIVVDEIFEVLNLDYYAQDSVYHYLERKLRNIQIELIRDAIEGILKRELRAISANQPASRVSFGISRVIRYPEPEPEAA